MIKFPEKLFVTGTGTDVGKTFVSGLLLSGLDAAYWKPVQSGSPTDTDFLKAATGCNPSKFKPEQYRFAEPVSPHLAAQMEGLQIQMDKFELPEHHEKHLIVEGAGGILVPLNQQHMMVDLIENLHLPVLVVAHSTLGTINHTLLTLKELRHRKIEIFGVFLNGPRNRSNKQAIETFGDTLVVGECERLPQVTAASLKDAFAHSFGDTNTHDSLN